MRCDKKVSLRGGFFYEVKKSRYLYLCFHCQKPILKGSFYVLERDLSGVSRRYHPECLEKTLGGRIKIKYVYERYSENVLLCVD